MKKNTVILILITFLYQNIAWGREFTLRPPLQGSLAQRAGEVLNEKAAMPQSNTDIPTFLLTGKIKLTKRQKAILDLRVKGWEEGDIATEFSIAKKTVNYYLYSIRGKLNLRGIGVRGAFLYRIYQKDYIITQPPKEMVTKIIDLASKLSIARREVLESAMSGNGSIEDIAAHLNKSKKTVDAQISDINRSFENIANENEFPEWKVDFWLAAAILSVNLEVYNKAEKPAERFKIIMPIRGSL